MKTPAVAEVAVARRKPRSRSGKQSRRTAKRQSPRRPRKLSMRPKIKKIRLPPTITKPRPSPSKYLNSKNLPKKRSPSLSLNLRLSHRCRRPTHR